MWEKVNCSCTSDGFEQYTSPLKTKGHGCIMRQQLWEHESCSLQISEPILWYKFAPMLVHQKEKALLARVLSTSLWPLHFSADCATSQSLTLRTAYRQEYLYLAVHTWHLCKSKVRGHWGKRESAKCHSLSCFTTPAGTARLREETSLRLEH